MLFVEVVPLDHPSSYHTRMDCTCTHTYTQNHTAITISITLSIAVLQCLKEEHVRSLFPKIANFLEKRGSKSRMHSRMTHTYKNSTQPQKTCVIKNTRTQYYKKEKITSGNFALLVGFVSPILSRFCPRL